MQGINLSSSENLAEIVLETMSNFSDHYSSTYLDHLAGKVTEIKYINGAILRIANEKRIHVPLNRLLTNVLNEIEEKRRTCKSPEEFYQKHDSYLESIKTQLFEITKLR